MERRTFEELREKNSDGAWRPETKFASFVENSTVVDAVRTSSSVVPCNLIQARDTIQGNNTDGHRPDANLILARDFSCKSVRGFPD